MPRQITPRDVEESYNRAGDDVGDDLPDGDSGYGPEPRFTVRRAFDGQITNGSRSPYADNLWCSVCQSTDCIHNVINPDGSRDW